MPYRRVRLSRCSSRTMYGSSPARWLVKTVGRAISMLHRRENAPVLMVSTCSRAVSRLRVSLKKGCAALLNPSCRIMPNAGVRIVPGGSSILRLLFICSPSEVFPTGTACDVQIAAFTVLPLGAVVLICPIRFLCGPTISGSPSLQCWIGPINIAGPFIGC